MLLSAVRRAAGIIAVIVLAMLALNLDAIQTLIVGCLSGMLAQEFGDVPFVGAGDLRLRADHPVYLPVTAVGILLYDILRRSQSPSSIPTVSRS